MKKILLILLSAVFIAGCSNNGEEPTSDPSEEKETQREKKDDETRFFQIGETADITTDSAGIPYQVTVNSFEFTTDDVEGVSLEDLNYTVEEGGEFAVVNVTMKNTSESSFVPQDYISAYLTDDGTGSMTPEDEVFKERFEELDPGEEITGNLVFTSTYFDSFDVMHLTYEIHAVYNEVKFELPIP